MVNMVLSKCGVKLGRLRWAGRVMRMKESYARKKCFLLNQEEVRIEEADQS